ncbi:MAG: hypothetical protein L0K86_15715 [Actinomycetia bacterium]|nr:hypothetical protein [Actinomycetes bacterium]
MGAPNDEYVLQLHLAELLLADATGSPLRPDRSSPAASVLGLRAVAALA